MLALPQLPSQLANEDRALDLLQACVAEEQALTDGQAAQELAPAINLCHKAIVSAALPYLESIQACPN